MPTAVILAQIRRLGYIVKEFRINGTVEYHAVPVKDDSQPQVARCNDGEDDEAAYRAACLLAEAAAILTTPSFDLQSPPMISLTEDQLADLLRHDFAFRYWLSDLGDRGIEPPTRIEPDIFGFFLDIIGMPEALYEKYIFDWLNIANQDEFPEGAVRKFVRNLLCEVTESREAEGLPPPVPPPSCAN